MNTFEFYCSCGHKLNMEPGEKARATCSRCRKNHKGLFNGIDKDIRVLIVHSKSTKQFAKDIGKKYYDPTYLLIDGTPKEWILKVKKVYNKVIGIGGGSVLDSAKIIAGDTRAIVIPTTASGAAMTPYATVWGESKQSVKTKKPILENIDTDTLELPILVQVSTFFDALSHSFESLWSKNATTKSKKSALKAIKLLSDYYKTGNISSLITGGNYAGEAICKAKTNLIHSISYPLTIKYGINHGLSCGLILPYILINLGDKDVYKLFKHKDLESFCWHLKKLFPYYAINIKAKKINWKWIIHNAFKYSKVYNTYLEGNVDESNIYEWIKELEYNK